MHGLIANQLRRYTLARHSKSAWTDALTASGSKVPRSYVPLDRTYPDADIVTLIGSLTQVTGMAMPDFLEDFGAYLAVGLLRVYEPLIKQGWRTLDIVESVEEHIHTAVRLRDPSAGPPYLSATRVSPTAVNVIYTSPRRLCKLGEGIIRGLAEHYSETVDVSQRECMLRGDSRCVISVNLQTS